jgi:V8-like Glu-specific endopeptidase
MSNQNFIRVLSVALCGVVLWALPTFAQLSSTIEVQSEVVPGTFDTAKAAADQHQLARQLRASEGKEDFAGYSVTPSATALDKLANAATDVGRLLVGTSVPIEGKIAFTAANEKSLLLNSNVPQARGLLRRTDDGFVWFTKVRSEGASAVRLHFVDFFLPSGAEMYVYTKKEAYGPYTGTGLFEDGEFWSHTVVGSEIRVQVRYRGLQVRRALRAIDFVLQDVVHLGEKFAYTVWTDPEADGNKAFCSFNASCVQNASCSSIPSAIAGTANGIAHLQFQVGSSTFICSGSVLNDTDGSTTIPYLLTANHCFSSQTSATSLAAFFQFTSSCGGGCGSASGNQMNGSTLLSTNATSDYTFVQMNGSLPAGSVLLGWSAAAVANSNGTALYRLSHPSGAPQAYSTHTVNTSAGTCGSWPRGNWIYSRDTFGATEGGSSGSAVLNASGQVVGQLSGGCGTNTANVCDSTNNATVDGALAAYFSSVSQWLSPAPGGCHTGSNGDWSYCSTSCTCDAGEGDCDGNAECSAGTTCVNDVGANYGWASTVDVCEASSCHVGSNGGWSYCSTSCPCDNGEGDCDSDAECNSGTECVDNVGANYGWASTVDVCETTSNPNSCVGFCGAQASGGCWCDSGCAGFGDCCTDKVAVCG